MADVLRAVRLQLERVAPKAVSAQSADAESVDAESVETESRGAAFDPQLTSDVLLPAFRGLYRRWFRVETVGAHHLPEHGAAIVAGNHAGGLWALDSVMTAVAVYDENPAKRHLRMLGADLIFQTPGLRDLAAMGGVAPASNDEFDRLLDAGELVGVWPEGYRGIGKPFAQRYQLQRFGRGGFVRAALRHAAPIIPTAIVGSEEIYPVLGNAPRLAQALHLPYFPLTPTFPWLGPLGLIPLPSKWLIEFLPPIPTESYGPAAAADPAIVADLVARVRSSIAESLIDLRARRRSAWF
jgi:1-acyl-sn-glycerol-3-phosphate acyltransferase